MKRVANVAKSPVFVVYWMHVVCVCVSVCVIKVRVGPSAGLIAEEEEEKKTLLGSG